MNIIRRYELEFVQFLIESALIGIGFTKTEIIIEIDEEAEVDPATGTELRHIRVETDFISFELHEVLMPPPTANGNIVFAYQPAFFRGILGTGEQPPDLDVIEGDIEFSPTVAICRAIQFCVEEVVFGRCNEMMYQLWLEERKEKQSGN